MHNFVFGIICVAAGIYLVESISSGPLVTGAGGLLILLGIYRFIVMILDTE
ncbi:MAG: hypothetical protein ACON3Z_17190 [Bradymonadia bacterium]